MSAKLFRACKRPVLLRRLGVCIAFAVFLLAASGCSAAPQEPSEDLSEDLSFTCTLSVECSTALRALSADDAAFLPQDGILLTQREVRFSENETVFDVLQRACREQGIPLVSSRSPLTGSVYIQGLGGLFEMDCGGGSGWMYCVNGVYPSNDCASCVLHEGDRVEIRFTCDNGQDIGNTTLQ